MLRTVVQKTRDFLKRISRHSRSQAYWKKATTTFLAPPEYYDRQEAIMRESLFPRLPDGGAVLDIGCGNGRFTLLFAERARSVLGIDISPSLVAEATKIAAERNRANVEYKTIDLLKEEIHGVFDVVSCLGVTSCIANEDLFRKTVRRLQTLARPDGYVVTKESLSLANDDVHESNGYVATYRNIDRYLKEFEGVGLRLDHEIELANFSGKTNRFFVFRKSP